MSFMMRRTPPWAKPGRGSGSTLWRASAGTCNASCRTPPARTPQASALTGYSDNGLNATAAVMSDTFIIVGGSDCRSNQHMVMREPHVIDVSSYLYRVFIVYSRIE